MTAFNGVQGGARAQRRRDHRDRGCARVALWYAKRGIRTFPLRPGCKKPAVAAWGEVATAVADRIDELFEGYPHAGIGIATGGGLFVVDIDPRHGGDIRLHELEGAYGELPETWRVRTPSGGSHFYFRADVPIRNKVDANDWNGIDIRGDGGYVVAPSTVLVPHAGCDHGGGQYVWMAESAPHEIALADAPPWLLAALSDERPAGEARPADEWAALVSDGAPEGSRNDSVARLAGYLLRRRPAPRVVLELIRAWNESRCRPPLSEDEILRTVDSICRAEAERRSS
jgi:hypothetical protein